MVDQTDELTYTWKVYKAKQMPHMEVGWSECDNTYDSGNNIILGKKYSK